MNFAGVMLSMFLITLFGFSANYAVAESWYIYEGQMPKQWQDQFGDVLYEATQYWEERFPGTKFYRVQFVDDADFVLQWASQFEGTVLGYYTSDTNNDYRKPYVTISLGYMTGDSFQDKKFKLVEDEYALAITTHEIGHAIGLGHSNDPNDIMYPTLENYQDWLNEHPSQTTDSDDSILEESESEFNLEQSGQLTFSTYDSDYGFSIDYPADWDINDEVFEGESFINYVQFMPRDGLTSIGVSKIPDDFEFRGLSKDQYLEKMVSILEEDCNNATYDIDNYVCSDFQVLRTDTQVDDYGNTWYIAIVNDHDIYSDGYETDIGTISYEMPYGDDTWKISILLYDDAFDRYSTDELLYLEERVTSSFVLTDTSLTSDTQTTSDDDSIQQTKYLLYENDDYGFSIKYPTNWQIDDELIKEEGYINYVQFSLDDSGTTFIDIYRIINDFKFRDLSTEQYLEKMVSSLEERCNNATYDYDNYVCSDFEELYSDTMVDDYGNTWYFATTNEHNIYSDGYETDTATILYEMPYGDDTWAVRMILGDDIFNQFSADEVDDLIETVASSFVLAEFQETNNEPELTSENEEISRQSDDNGGGCLIATATYGSEMVPQVQFLREIRDNTVFSTASGTSFMTAFNSFYYSFSPAVADLERQNPAFKEAVKITITPLLSTLSILNYVEIDSEAEMLGYGIGIILLNIGMYFVAPAILILKLKPIIRTKLN